MNQALHTGKIETQTSHIYIYIYIPIYIYIYMTNWNFWAFELSSIDDANIDALMHWLMHWCIDDETSELLN